MPFPHLETERLHLRQITIEDLKQFFILKSDERLLSQYDAKAKTFEETRQFLLRINEQIKKNECMVWGIAHKAENQLIGSICYWNIHPDQSKGEIGYELMLHWQGKGMMQEAIQVVIEYGFRTMNLRVIEAYVHPSNTKSIKLLQRNHFRREEENAEGKMHFLRSRDTAS